MIVELSEAILLDQHHQFSEMELVELSGLSITELQLLVECEALSPVSTVEPAAETRFNAECLALARTASRLRNDFDLDANGLALTLRLLNRIHELEAELRHLQAQQPR